MTIQKIVPSLWYAKDAEQAARFYASVFPDSRVDTVTPLPADTPSGPAGSVNVVSFTLFGQPFMAMTAGPLDDFNHSISFTIECEDQAEVDRYWDKLVEGGGKHEECGWLKDRFGVYWQITPRVMFKFMTSPDKAAARRACEAMLTMKKLDIAKLQQAFDGR